MQPPIPHVFHRNLHRRISSTFMQAQNRGRNASGSLPDQCPRSTRRRLVWRIHLGPPTRRFMACGPTFNYRLFTLRAILFAGALTHRCLDDSPPPRRHSDPDTVAMFSFDQVTALPAALRVVCGWSNSFVSFSFFGDVYPYSHPG